MPVTSRSLIRRLFYRSQLFRVAVGCISILIRRTQSIGISHLLSYVNKNALGPLQRDEAIALFGIVKTLCPKTIVEFGFFHGHSAFNFLCALEPDARLYSYDISLDSAMRAKEELSFDHRLTFIHKSQADFNPSDIDHRPIDFVFFDAAHDLALNIETFKRIVHCLAPGAIIAIHDTGLWQKSHFSHAQTRVVETATHGRWITNNLYAHQPEERAFVNWIVSHQSHFGAIHFHSINTLRHGFSLLQLQLPLPNAA
jgi:predicted O-methyltransferase YrrM